MRERADSGTIPVATDMGTQVSKRIFRLLIT